VGAGFRHFLPSHTVRRFDYGRRYVAFAVDLLLRREERAVGFLEAAFRMSPRLQGWLHSHLRDSGIETPEDELDAAQLLAVFRQPRLTRRPDIDRAITKGLAPWMKSSPVAGFTAFASSSLPFPFNQAVQSVSTHLGSSVRYLGPLREEPRIMYASFGPTQQVGDVGTKGQLSAAVLASLGDQQKAYWDPRSSQMREGTLRAAVDAWMQYFGLGEQVVSVPAGKLGHSLDIEDRAIQRHLDLTDLGFGVSQVLPILVGVLAAPPDAVFLLEQPEIHLHPLSQALLADFLLGHSQTGMQFIVETHSEHLVNRLRRRIAESYGGIGADHVRLYFVSRESGVSRFSPLEVNEYGAIENWPEGFFDETQLEAERILRAGLARRGARSRE